MSGIPSDHVRIARVVGETDEGLTLFVPKDMQGKFDLTPGEDGEPVQFLTFIFTKQVDGEPGQIQTWLPWESTE